MTKSPTPWSLNLPKIWTSITVACAIFVAGAQDSPDLVGQLKIPAAVMTIISALAATSKSGVLVKQASQSLPPHLVTEDGDIDTRAVIAMLKQDAFKRGNAQLDQALSTLPLPSPSAKS